MKKVANYNGQDSSPADIQTTLHSIFFYLKDCNQISIKQTKGLIKKHGAQFRFIMVYSFSVAQHIIKCRNYVEAEIKAIYLPEELNAYEWN